VYCYKAKQVLDQNSLTLSSQGLSSSLLLLFFLIFVLSTLTRDFDIQLPVQASSTKKSLLSLLLCYLIGINEFLSIERTDVELKHTSMQVISKADRLKLSASDKSKIYASFIKGTTNKFKATSTIVGLDEISTFENITSFAELCLKLQRHITSISVHPVFLILQFNHDGTLINPDTPEGAPSTFSPFSRYHHFAMSRNPPFFTTSEDRLSTKKTSSSPSTPSITPAIKIYKLSAMQRRSSTRYQRDLGHCTITS
jgi:hypothetical protein